MSDVCFIHAYPGASETLRLLWPGFNLLECPIIGVDCVDGACEWPEPVTKIALGYNRFWMRDPRNLPLRLVNTLRHFLWTQHERAIVLEYDTLITRKPPEFPTGLVTHRSGGQLPDCIVDQFFATPWICDRETAEKIVEVGSQLIQLGVCDTPHMGSPDVFLAYVVREAGIEWKESGTFAANTIEGVFVEPARRAYRGGAWMLHGIKTREQLQAVVQ